MKRAKILSVLMAASMLLASCSLPELPELRSRDEEETGEEDEEETETSETSILVLTPPSEHPSESKPSETRPSETTETTAPVIDADYAPAYINTINDYIDNYENETDELRYDLIYVNEDDIPELVIGLPGYYVSLYTYSAGQVYTVMDEYGYGAMGNHGYSYIPKQNVISCDNSDLAGALMWEIFWKMNDLNVLEPLYDEDLNIRYFESEPDEFYPEDLSNIDYTDNPYYYYGTTPLTQSEYLAYIPQGDYKYIEGVFDYDTIIEALETGVMPDRPSYYSLMIDNVTWEEADQKARESGGQLVIINDQEELETVSSLILEAEYTNIVWYVGAREDRAGNMTWTDGSSIEASFWLSGEPTGTGTTEDGRELEEDFCAALYRDSEQELRLMDVPGDMLDAAPSYNGIVGYIIEYEA